MLFKQCLAGEKVGAIKGISIDPDILVSGLADVPGELLRYAIKSATERKFDLTKRCYELAEDIIGEMVTMDLTGYHRQKFDQAKQSLHKLQHVVYEVSLRQGGGVL
jgi:predicted translin family RNA/ssDNA-binding protein